MMRKILFTIVALAAAFALGVAITQAQNPQGSVQTLLGTGFTYQGYLKDGDNPANGVYDFKFSLYDAASGGSQVGGNVFAGDVAVEEGLFTATLDFGASVFTGDARFLSVGVREGGSTGPYDTFAQRVTLTASPYALYSTKAPWSGLAGVPAGFADGTDDNTTYSAGTGLTLSGTQFGINPSVAQLRVTGSCSVGSAIQTINQDGTVTCQSASGGFTWGTVASGNGTGLTLTSNDGIPLSLQGGADTSADLVLAGNSGIITSDPNDPNSDLELEGVDHVYITSNDGSITLDANEGYSGGTVYLQAYDRIDLDAREDEVWIEAGLNVDNTIGTDGIGLFQIRNGDYNVVFSINENGNLMSVGSQTTAAQTDQHGLRAMPAIASPQSWFEDFGTAQLQNGRATVRIEPVFAETVNLAEPYHVFLTPLGDCPLFAAQKTTTSFTVQAMGGQSCSIAFDYRIVAQRLGYEDVRLEAVELPPDKVDDHEDR